MNYVGLVFSIGATITSVTLIEEISGVNYRAMARAGEPVQLLFRFGSSLKILRKHAGLRRSTVYMIYHRECPSDVMTGAFCSH